MRVGPLVDSLKAYTITGWMDGARRILLTLLSKSFFGGYDPLTEDLATRKRNELMSQHGAIPFSCFNDQGQSLDALSLCTNRTQSQGTIIFAETTSYQDRLFKQIPHQYEYFLNCGFEVIVWNPSTPRFTSRHYSSDLSAILKEVRKVRGAGAALLVKAHCATVEPTLAAATKLHEHSSVVLILDRGYADAVELARSTTVVCAIPVIKHLIREEFACDGKNKLRQFLGRIIWVSPEDQSADQMMYWPKTGENLSLKMQDLRAHKGEQDQRIRLGVDSDHWSHWNKDDYAAMTSALLKMDLIKRAPELPHTPQRKPVPFCRRNVMPYLLNKAWC